MNTPVHTQAAMPVPASHLDPPAASDPPALLVSGLGKRYGSLVALDDRQRGEFHALCAAHVNHGVAAQDLTATAPVPTKSNPRRRLNLTPRCSSAHLTARRQRRSSRSRASRVRDGHLGSRARTLVREQVRVWLTATTAGQTAAARTFAAASRPGVAAVADYANPRNPKLVSADGRTTWALINLANPDKGPGVGAGDRLAPEMKAAAPAGAALTVTGFSQLLAGSGGGSGPSVLLETLIGAAGALIVLLAVYGSAIAIVPLLMAAPVILVTFLGVLGLTYLTGISYFIQYLAPLVGLGVAVDYSLLVVVRWREERQSGRDNEAAIIAAGARAGKAVLLSGATVAVGLLSLVVLPVPFLRSIGLGGMLIPLVAILAAVTLLPVTLSAWGPALERRRFRTGSSTYSHAWERWGRAIVRRRWLAGLAGIVILAALSAPALSINTAEPLARSLPGGGAAGAAFTALERQGVPDAVVFPVQVLTHGGRVGVQRATAVIDRTPGIYTTLAPPTSSFRHGSDGLVTAIPRPRAEQPRGRT